MSHTENPTALIPTGIQIANGLIGIHHHDEATGKKFYYEDELLELFTKRWGFPEPDWEGNAKQIEQTRGAIWAALMDMHPSTTIKDLMEARGMDENQLATALELTVKGTIRILDHGGAFSSTTAAKLQEVFGVPAEKWLKMQERYLAEFDRMFSQSKTTGNDPAA